MRKSTADSASFINKVSRAKQSDNKLNLMSDIKAINNEDSYEKGTSPDISDPNMLLTGNKGPRRPLSPYIFFSQEKRKELKKEHPEWNSQQIMKMVSSLWQKMSNEDKTNFQEQSKLDRDRYDNERQDFINKRAEDREFEQHSVLDTVRNRSKIIQKIKEEKK
jgi:hypothetical protein